jgi:site-specific recombinase XerD
LSIDSAVQKQKTINEAMEGFLADITAGHSPATAKTYRVALTRFTTYLKDHLKLDIYSVPAAQLETDWAVNCVRWIANGQPAALTDAIQANTRTPRTTTATYVAGLSRFYRWCAIERLLQLPGDEYERMTLRFKDLRGKVQRTIIDKVPADKILDKLLEHARLPISEASNNSDETENNQERKAFKGNTRLTELDRRRRQLIRLRNIALLETLRSTGARVSEVCELKRGALDQQNQRARVVGKGSKERWIYFSPTAWEAIQEYLLERGRAMIQIAGEQEPEGDPRKRGRGRIASELALQPVFSRHDRGAGWKKIKSLLPHAVETMLWNLVEESGLEASITPHKFRHWFATKMLAATGDLATTQDLLGHANPATTRIYAQVSERKKQEAHRLVFGTGIASENEKPGDNS